MEAEETERNHKQIKYTFPAARPQRRQTVACSQVKPDTQATHRQVQVYMGTDPQTPCRHVQACIAWLVRIVGGGRGVCHWPQDHAYKKPYKVALTQEYFYDTLHTCLPCVPAYSMLTHSSPYLHCQPCYSWLQPDSYLSVMVAKYVLAHMAFWSFYCLINIPHFWERRNWKAMIIGEWKSERKYPADGMKDKK